MQILKVFAGSRLPSLDGLRFLAALLVVFGHGGLPLPAGDGVTYFFVLSGLLFSWMFQREWGKTATIDFKGFYIRRTFRIIPAFYVALLFTVCGKLALKLPVNYAHALASGAFAGNYYNAFHGHPPTGFDLYWSLGVEEQFYLVWPLCFVYFMKRGPDALLKFLVFAICTVCAWRSLLTLGYDVQSPYLYNAFDTRFDSLALGCLAGLLIMNPRFTTFLEKITHTGLEPLVPLAGIVALNGVSEKVRFSIGLTAQSALMAVFIVQLVILHESRYWRWLNHRLLIFLGTLSYSTYLYHGWGLALGYKFKMLPEVPRVCMGLLSSIGLAWLSYTGIEQPALKLRKRFEARFL